jgi:hypothetical protein
LEFLRRFVEHASAERGEPRFIEFEMHRL